MPPGVPLEYAFPIPVPLLLGLKVIAGMLIALAIGYAIVFAICDWKDRL